MAQIRVIWHGTEPNFPASAQHQQAKRYFVYADGSISEEVEESKHEAAQIDGYAALTSDLEATQGGLTRLIELRERALAAVSGEQVEAKSGLEHTLENNRRECARMTVDLGTVSAKVMPSDQRAFLRRIAERKERTAFIDGSRAERREIMTKSEAIKYAVDAIGAPTLAEIDAILKGA